MYHVINFHFGANSSLGTKYPFSVVFSPSSAHTTMTLGFTWEAKIIQEINFDGKRSNKSFFLFAVLDTKLRRYTSGSDSRNISPLKRLEKDWDKRRWKLSFYMMFHNAKGCLSFWESTLLFRLRMARARKWEIRGESSQSQRMPPIHQPRFVFV